MHEKGRRGEEEAARFLGGQGYRIVARNFRSRRGEVDIVALKDETVVFVEVKKWDALPRDSLEHSLSDTKRGRILQTSRLFLERHPEYLDFRVRFDLIHLHGTPTRVRHLENAFGDGGW